MKISTHILGAALATALVAGAPDVQAQNKQAVIDAYVDIAAAVYSDSLSTAQTLDSAIAALIAAPSP